MIAGTASGIISHAKEAATRTARSNATIISHLAIAHFEQTAELVDRFLIDACEAYRDPLAREDIPATLPGTGFPSSVVQLALIDRNGIFIASNLSDAHTPRVDLSDRDHVRVHLTRPLTDRLHISAPLRGRVSGQWTIQFTRPMFDIGGDLVGVIVASFDMDDMSRFYAGLGMPPERT